MRNRMFPLVESKGDNSDDDSTYKDGVGFLRDDLDYVGGTLKDAVTSFKTMLTDPIKQMKKSAPESKQEALANFVTKLSKFNAELATLSDSFKELNALSKKL